MTSQVTVKKVKLKVLEISEEAGGDPQPPVDVDLRYTEPPLGKVGEQDIYQGEMIYWDPIKKKCTIVDFVDAIFPADAIPNKPGNIDLQITLKGGNKFRGDHPVTTVPGGKKNTVPDHCVDIKKSSDTMVTITFIEPAKGEFVAYPALYFNTTQGIIDPGISVRRKPG